MFTALGSGGALDFLLTPSDAEVTEMDAAAFVCVPSEGEAMWMFDTLDTTIGPNAYFINITNVVFSSTILCTTNDNSSSANLTVQGNVVLVVYCVHVAKKASALHNKYIARGKSTVILECTLIVTKNAMHKQQGPSYLKVSSV